MACGYDRGNLGGKVVSGTLKNVKRIDCGELGPGSGGGLQPGGGEVAPGWFRDLPERSTRPHCPPAPSVAGTMARALPGGTS
jgi:hypothetical protein